MYELCSASYLQGQNSWAGPGPFLCPVPMEAGMLQVPCAVLATTDCKAQKEFSCMVVVFSLLLLLKTGLKALLLLVLSGQYERAVSLIGPVGLLFQMFFFTKLLNRK